MKFSVLQDNFFSTNFMKIEYLDLSHNGIAEIEENALDNLVNLESLNLESNRLEVLNSFVFRNNKRLEYINLNKNEIQKINRRALKNLKNLKFVQLEKNECIKKSIGCSNCSISEEDLENELGECYRRYYQIDLDNVKGKIFYVDLSESSERVKLTVNGTEEEKKSVIEFRFRDITKIDYIPVEIFTEFPNLKRIEISRSNIPIVKENLFGKECESIEILWFIRNEIKSIERKAFSHLKNLVKIKLRFNKIESISYSIFQTNSKLEEIDFRDNQIKALNPVIFKHLNHLKIIDFSFNRCVSHDFGCEKNCTIDQEELNKKLTPRYDNCIKDKECTANSKTLTKRVKCKFYESDLHLLLPTFNFCQITKIDLSFTSFDNNFTFVGVENKLKETTAVEIKKSSELDFVPVEMSQKFPSLRGLKLKITYSKIEILRENLFTRQFVNITYLDLSSNGIQKVFDAFKNLQELRWIILANNSIETLIYRVFKNNKKLEVIDLQKNKIKMINIKLFLNLAELQVVNFRGNECADKSLFGDTIYEKSRQKLSNCFKNCQEDRKCFLLSNDDEVRTENRPISCNYNGVQWDQKTTCFVTEQSFKMPHNYSIISYRFSGSEDQKGKTTAVYFEFSLTVDFVPFEIFENFPKLDSIAFIKSEIPMITNKLFAGQNFEQIKELRLNEDKIRFIETGAFVDLKNLEEIDLTNNKI
jgi:Leucine-rich repeat (LRR) protein